MKRENRQLGGVWIFLALAILAYLLYLYGERWLRFWLIELANAGWARALASGFAPAWQVASRFVAGETIDEAMVAARELNKQGALVTLDYLGESVTDSAEAEASRDEILRLLDQISETGVEANVSVKLSQLGLKIDPALALGNMRLLLARAQQHSNKIRIDMEESALVDTTLDIYRTLRDKDGYRNVGVVIQSYLYRSAEDVSQLISEGAWVRLCKGAYAEPPDVAFPDKEDTDASYNELTRQMLSSEARKNGVYLGVATHDEKIIQATIDFVHDRQISSDEFEFQMLFGIRRELQQWLLDQGYRLRVYVPYGTAWYAYFMRRLAERPANMWFFISNLLRS